VAVAQGDVRDPDFFAGRGRDVEPRLTFACHLCGCTCCHKIQ
jgi:hypothetical protein